jgi:hypothetical protein
MANLLMYGSTLPLNSGEAQLKKKPSAALHCAKMGPSSIIPALEANSRRKKAQGGRDSRWEMGDTTATVRTALERGMM